MSNYGPKRTRRQGKAAIQGRLTPRDLPPEGPANRRQRRAAAKLKKAPE